MIQQYLFDWYKWDGIKNAISPSGAEFAMSQYEYGDGAREELECVYGIYSGDGYGFGEPNWSNWSRK